MLLNEFESDMKSLKCIPNVDLILNYVSGFLLYKEKELTRAHSEKMAEEGRRSYCMMDIQNDREKSLRGTFEKIRRLEITQGSRESEEEAEEEEEENRDVDGVIREIVNEMIENKDVGNVIEEIVDGVNENKDADNVIKEIVDEMIVNLQYIIRKAEKHHAVLGQKATQVMTTFYYYNL